MIRQIEAAKTPFPFGMVPLIAPRRAPVKPSTVRNQTKVR
jgi:hypothetical protein